MLKMISKMRNVMLTLLVVITLVSMCSESTFAASKLTITPTNKTVNVGKTVTLKSNKSVRWSVSKGAKYVSLLSKKAKSVNVKGIKTGTATIKAKDTKTGAYKTIKVTVIPELKVTGNKTINVGSKITLKSNNDVKWSISEGSAIVSISSKKGKSANVTGLKKGTAKIKATDSKTGTYKTIKVTVIPELQISVGADTIEEGTSTELKTNNDAKWEIIAGQDVIEISIENKVATVKGVKEGTATIKVTDAKTGAYKKIEIVVTAKKTEPVEPSEPEVFEPEIATEEEVNAIINGTDTTTILVDARPQEAYAGWPLQGAKNGGHLKNAILYSARWLDFEMSESKREKKLKTYNSEIELCDSKSYIVYDYNGMKDAAKKVAEYFYEKGIKNVKIFDAKEIIDNGYDIEAYKNYDRYIPAEIVKDISDYKTGLDDTLEPSTLAVIDEEDIDKIVLLDVSYGNVHESSYLTDGHVPGAIHINTNAYERPRSYTPEKREQYSIEYSLIPLDEFRDDVCTEYGITKDSIVIATSSENRPIARIGYMFRSLGVKFYGMSGCMNAWKYNGYRLDTTEVVRPDSVEDFGIDNIPYPEEIVWMDEIKEILAANGEDEKNHTAGTIIGGDKTSKTYSYHDLMGKIPGTVNPENDGVFENVDGTPAMKELFLKYYDENNIPTDKLIVHCCGDGWGAARDAYNAQSVDLDNVKYWGEGWVVWSNRGNWFIDYTGRRVRYDKYIDQVVDEDGNIIVDDKVFKIE